MSIVWGRFASLFLCVSLLLLPMAEFNCRKRCFRKEKGSFWRLNFGTNSFVFFFLLLEKSIFGKFQISFELNNTLCVGSSMEVMVIAFYCQFLFIYIFHVNVFSAFRALIRKHYHYYSYQKMSVDGVPSEIGNCDCSCKCFFIRCRCRHRHHHCCWKCVFGCARFGRVHFS